ncbi:hypothetical protein E3O45_08780 [Cryobacterium sp. TMS1-20-1]|uniref:NUDIX domain-containing protein n=1 Tax=Cryobacterium sp. TMS1-20-1 TaxID=1259223 RepID=UPI00106CF3D9|nr:NUDIX domain-containing protein [Cryobacterium sp. TMS1-20-1]TFC75861.1 hypothetical protein E3O45_08780 [Cryobacterium sp. TMS1-20-1]
MSVDVRAREDGVVFVREVVAEVVIDGERICLLKRSMSVESDRGLWHYVTGHLALGSSPSSQMLIELREELGLLPEQIRSVRSGLDLRLADGKYLWIVHTFEVETSARDFQLNWENDGFVWAAPVHIPDECVTWLADVIASIV